MLDVELRAGVETMGLGSISKPQTLNLEPLGSISGGLGGGKYGGKAWTKQL